ncbi:MAG: GNAT family N-acetyltransferase [Candidatus Omnitrophica bacterium]|nr:GNAT family N-acetyltransferase [Candidatus Omnitrophota bacterium]
MRLKIRTSDISDCRDLWEWRNHPDVRKWAFDPSEIAYEEHKKWFERKITDEDVEIYIAENENGKKLGQVRFDVGTNDSIVSVNLNPDFFGQGLGHRIIKEATDVFLESRNDIKTVNAQIMKENIASRKAFEKAGYTFAEERDVNGRGAEVFVYKR